MADAVLTDENVHRWLAELEGWLPTRINGLTGEGADALVRHEYVPRSARIAEFRVPEQEQSVCAAHLVVTYNVSQVTGVVNGFSRVQLRGVVETPVGLDGSLCLGDADPLEGVLDDESAEIEKPPNP